MGLAQCPLTKCSVWAWSSSGCHYKYVMALLSVHPLHSPEVAPCKYDMVENWMISDYGSLELHL